MPGCGCGSGRRHGRRPTIGPRPAKGGINRVPSRRQQLKALKSANSERQDSRITIERKRRAQIARRKLNK